MNPDKNHTSLFVINNTIIVAPYLLYLSLSNDQSMAGAFSFALFYTFRMVSVFILQTFETLNAHKLLSVSIITGIAGSLIGLFSYWWESALVVSAVLMGISASWLPPADLMVRQIGKIKGQPVHNDFRLAFIHLLMLLFSLGLKNPNKGLAIFGCYLIFYTLAAISIKALDDLPNRKIKVVPNKLFNKQVLLYSLFFILLLSLRTGRITQSSSLFEGAIIGFLVLFALLLLTFVKRDKLDHFPFKVNTLSFLFGVMGNFLLLFGSSYMTARFGPESLSLRVYLPYALGLFGAIGIGSWLAKKLGKIAVTVYIVGLILSTGLFAFDQTIVLSLFFGSFFNSAINQWVLQEHLMLPNDIEHQSLEKFAIQNKGSLVHQFLMMTLMFVVIRLEHRPLNFLFELSGAPIIDKKYMLLAFLQPVRLVSVLFLICFLLGSLLLLRNDKV